MFNELNGTCAGRFVVRPLERARRSARCAIDRALLHRRVCNQTIEYSLLDAANTLDPNTVLIRKSHTLFTRCIRFIACVSVLMFAACRSTPITIDAYRDAPIIVISIDTLRA